MAAKKVGFKPKPNNDRPGNVDNWVAERNPVPVDRESEGEDASPQQESKPKMKRLTIDVDEELHRAIKLKAVELGVPMADMLRELLSSNYRSEQ